MNQNHLIDKKGIYHLTLNIINKDSVLEFYKDILGMKIISQNKDESHLGFHDEVILTLKHDQPYLKQNTRTQGLYHVAYLVPGKKHLAEFLRKLKNLMYPIQGLGDHGVSIAIYLSDPEGNGIEVYYDQPKTKWPYQNDKLMMKTDPVDVDDLLAFSKSANSLPNSTKLGHIHLHVGDVKKAETFYQEKLGYKITQRYGSMASFLSDGEYHHFLGINEWLGKDIPVKNLNENGLRGYKVFGKEDTKMIDFTGVELEITKDLI